MQHFLDELDDEELRLLLTGLPDGLLERLRRKILGGGRTSLPIKYIIDVVGGALRTHRGHNEGKKRKGDIEDVAREQQSFE